MNDNPSYQDLQQQISKLKAQNEKLQHIERNLTISNRRYKGLFDQSLDGNIVIDNIGNIIESNESFAKMHGYTIDEILKRNLKDLNIPDDNKLMKSRMSKLQNGKFLHFEVEHYHKDGHIITLDVVANIIKDDNKSSYYLSSHRDITYKKEVERVIVENKNQYKYFFDNSPLAMLLIDAKNKTFVDANIEACKFYGYSKEELLSLKITDINTHSKQSIERAMQKFDMDKTKILYFNHRLANGDIIPVEVYSRKIIMDDKPLFLSVVNDISQRTKVENELIIAKDKAEETEKILTTFIDSIPDIVCYKNAKGEWLLANDADIELFDLKGVDYFGKTDLELAAYTNKIYQDSFKACVTSDEEAWKKGDISNGIEIIPTIEGETKIYDVFKIPLFHDDEERKALAVIGRDITKLYETQERLRIAKEKAENSERKFNDILNKTKIQLWAFDGETYNYLNQEWYDYTGLEYEEKPSVNMWHSVLHPDDKETSNKVWIKNYNDKTEHDNFFRIKRHDGVYRNFYSHSVPIFDNDNNFIHFLGFNLDITEQKIAEEALKMQNAELIVAKEKAEESDRLKSAFLANMSHEIRTPMNGILGFASLLHDPKLNGEQQRDFIDIIEKAGERMLNIINDIVNISKIESGLMELDIKDSNINEQLDYIYTFFKPQIEEKGISFNLIKPTNLKDVIIRTDREKVFAIFTNLVKNAIKYCDEGSIDIGCTIKNNFLEFYVKDTGTGIPENRQSAVFERFIQADITDKMAKQGAGLGLSISKAYVEMLGGEIWLESKEEDLSKGIKSGSAFYFTLPYNDKVMDEEISFIEELKPNKNSNKKLKILIAEDDPTSQMFVSIAVKSLSSEILTVDSGDKAVETCKNNPDVDLILMDIQMPKMNGYEATKQIRKFNKDVIIIAQTAFALEGDMEKTIAIGCNDYVSKPIKIDNLKNIISKYF